MNTAWCLRPSLNQAGLGDLIHAPYSIVVLVDHSPTYLRHCASLWFGKHIHEGGRGLLVHGEEDAAGASAERIRPFGTNPKEAVYSVYSV
jgi:hypothetical protein